ncbi:TPA_asm: oncoid [Powellomyces chytrid fungus MELD virus 3]|nr:TPA_asm: oncoid [Powellomyces chytrid fungus MELD virus 3]
MPLLPTQPKAKRSDRYYTPPSALEPLAPFVKGFTTIWDGAAGDGHITRFFADRNHVTLATDIMDGSDHDFLTFVPPEKWDIMISNPPYSLKKEFVQRCFDLGKPFALLLPLNCIESLGVRNILKTRT